MTQAQPAGDDAIREQAYYLWEKDGRPHGRETEYWMRAVVVASEKSQMDTLTQPPPKKLVPKEKIKPVAKLGAAASKTKSVPSKSTKIAVKKPKKK
jgi:Protein of unknown function (DUF2934)